MLQWMGGSRRKVTASRKSTQKRQKQYFEQRKRQQLQSEVAYTENNVDGLATHDDEKRNRSLDILSLLNVSKVTEQSKPLYGIENGLSMTNKATRTIQDLDSSMYLLAAHASCVSFTFIAFRMMSFLSMAFHFIFKVPTKKSEGHAFPASYHTSKSTPNQMIDEPTATEFTLPSQTREPSPCKLERLSSKKSVDDHCGNSSYGKNMDSEYLKNASSVQPSLFEIIGDDGAIDTLDKEPVQEAHVAFSIEGLGKVGTETPMQSPQHLGSMLNGDQSSFTKAAKKMNSFKNFNTLRDELATDVDCLMEDVEIPSRHNLLSRNKLGPFSDSEHELSTSKDCMHYDVKQYKMNSHCDEDEAGYVNFWNASSSFLDYPEVDEKCGVNWKNSDPIDNSFVWRNDSSDFNIERCYSPLRWQEKMPDNILDGNFHFASFDEPKYSSSMCNYHPQDRFSHFINLKDTGDSLASLGGETSSSAAVRGGCSTDMPSARRRKRHGGNVNMVLEVNDEGFQYLTSTSTSLRQEACKSSRKHTRSSSLHSKSPFFSQAPVYEHEGHCLFKEEFSLPKINSQLGSTFGSFEKNQNLGGDSFSLYTGTDFCRSKFSFKGSEKDTPIEFTSENFDARQPFRSRKSFNSSFISKSVFGDTLLDARDVEVHIQSSSPPETYGDIESPLSPELSAQESVTENVENCSKSKTPCPEKLIQVSTEIKDVPSERRLPIQEMIVKNYSGSRKLANNGISQEVRANAVEANAEDTSLSIKLTRDSDEEPKTPTELQGGTPPLCQQKVKVSVDDVRCYAGNNMAYYDNLKGPEPKTGLTDPCYQVMTVERA
ncbi:uncharacterized protein LOC130813036 isoform X3 [Amaranthus tricolor]|uniref:uncharacterized protein LOC130813036 isoform X3 n=1 Tax=Amaranthus tricolor TaxID=29722 RepID=UPI00258F566D|nr:uncharacterized protein LOC130813036 isoform X3 [Amaranthus tricolor]